MTTTVTARTTSAPPVLDLDARLALTGAEMGSRLDQAAVAFEVNTAHIPGADPIPDTLVPQRLTPTSAPCPYRTPIAALLHRARARLDTDGWTRGALRDQQGARCLIGAIRAEAASRHQADDACVLLLDTIRRDFPHAETIPAWNDAQRDPQLPGRYLDRATEFAHARSL